MADKMLRMAGRGDDGKAKALKTDNEGNLGVQLTGSIVEDEVKSDVVVPANGEVGILDYRDNEHNQVSFLAYGLNGVSPSDIRCETQFYISAHSSSAFRRSVDVQRVSDRVFVEKPIGIVSPNRFRIFLINDSDQELTVNNIYFNYYKGEVPQKKPEEFYGLSSDTKPTNVVIGSTYLEVDTKQVYIYNGSSWEVF